MWRTNSVLLIALLCAAVSFGFNSNSPSTGGGGIVGGTCTGSDFINAITTTGVISCATPAGGGGGLPTPVSVANGGLGQGAAPGVANILVATSATTYTPVAMSGDVGITGAGVTTVASLAGVPVGRLATLNVGNGLSITGTNLNLTTPVSVANGGLGFNAIAPTVGQIPIALTAAAYVARTISGDATLTSQGVLTVVSVNGQAGPFLTGAAGSITDAMLANAYSGVGACAAGSFVSTLNRNAAPTCTAAAPSANPAGGQNNYAPIAGPTFTGTVTAPGLNLTATPPSLLFNGTAMGGTCTAGSFVTSISNTGVPTCAPGGGGGGGVSVGATPPATPTLGQLWFDTVSIQLYIWNTDANGSHWMPTINQPPSQVANVSIGATAPAAPTVGALWFNTDNVQMYIWYNSGASSQWVPVAHP